MTINGTFFALAFTFIFLIIFTIRLSRTKNKNQVHNQFVIFNSLLVIYLIGMMLQILFSKINIPPIYFEYITYIGAMFMPVTFTMIGMAFRNKAKDIKRYGWLYLLPLILLLGLWTNDVHHLFYKVYDITFVGTEFGILAMVFSIYSYANFIISLILMIEDSLKKTGFFSKQIMLLITAILVPLIGNMIGFFNIVPTNVYTTPILFSVMSMLLYLAIFKFKALNVTPVAFRTVINTMTDGFVVISDDGTIADMNKTFKDTFGQMLRLETNGNFYDAITKTNIISIEKLKKDIEESRTKQDSVTKEYSISRADMNRDFEIDIQPVKSKSGNEYVATLLLFRDVTQQKKDIERMTKNENLVILGELAGGVAHDINTPISAIKSGILMLKDTVKTEDEKSLLGSMDRCADKIIVLVNSMRNQIRNIGSNVKVKMKISDVIQDTKVIANNEIMKNNIKLNVNVKDDVSVMGEPTKLGQVITNIVMNSIQAYENKGGEINVELYKSENNEAVIIVEDFAGGIPENVKPYIFKNILTTKGVAGTGFGLYLAYSVIKGAFGGDIRFESTNGKGTRFYITIPLED